MKDFYNLNKKTINQLLSFGLGLIFMYIFFKYIFRLVCPFILAFLLSKIIGGPVDYVSKKTFMPRGVAVALSMVIVFSALGAVLYLGVTLLSRQILSFTMEFPNAFEGAVDLLEGFKQSYNDFFDLLPAEIGAFFEDTVVTMVPAIISAAGNTVKDSSVSFVKFLPKTMFFIIVTIISTFFMSKDMEKITAFVKRQLPPKAENLYHVIKNDIFAAIWGYVKAQLIMMSFTGAIAIIGLWILGYSYAFLIGLSIAILDALPVFGSGFILWPWALYNVLAGEYRFAFGLFCIYLFILMFRQFVEPKILSSQIGLHPLITIAALYAGLLLIGPLGLIAGPVFAVIMKSLQKAKLLPDFK